MSEENPILGQEPQHPSNVPHETAWELAQTEKFYRDLGPTPVNGLMRVVHPHEAAEAQRFRLEREAAVEVTHNRIKKAESFQQDPLSQKLYAGFVTNISRRHPDSAIELYRMSQMPGDELYKYVPEEPLAAMGLDLIDFIRNKRKVMYRNVCTDPETCMNPAVESGGAVHEDFRKFVNDLHTLAGTLEKRGDIHDTDPLKPQRIITHSDLGFSIFEDYTHPPMPIPARLTHQGRIKHAPVGNFKPHRWPTVLPGVAVYAGPALNIGLVYDEAPPTTSLTS